MSDAKVILVIDTAMDGCGVCVYDAGRDTVFDAYDGEAHGQAQIIVPLVQRVLDDAGIGFDALSDIIVCNGPGTFTGIRIGLSAAKAFGLVVDAPVWGISSLQALALSAGVDSDVLAVVESRRQDFYVQEFGADGMAAGDARSAMKDDVHVGERVLIGNAVARFDPDGVYKDAKVKRIDVGVVAKYFVDNPALFEGDVAPIYLRAPDVSQPKSPPRTLKSNKS